MPQIKSTTLLISIIGKLLNLLAFFNPSKAAKVAINIFAKPRKGRLSPGESSFLSSAQQLTLDYRGTRIMTYYWPGDKGCVLLAHGWESNSIRWEKTVDSLKEKNIAAVALDAPAHGASGGKYFQAVLYGQFISVVAAHFGATAMIGHSVGGMACAFSMGNSELSHLKKLILLGAPNHFTGVLERYCDMLGYSNRLRHAIDREVIRRFGAAPKTFSTENYLKGTGIDTLIVHDINDRIIPYSDAQSIVSHCQEGQLISTDGYGHGLKHPEVVSEIVSYICN